MSKDLHDMAPSMGESKLLELEAALDVGGPTTTICGAFIVDIMAHFVQSLRPAPALGCTCHEPLQSGQSSRLPRLA